MNKTKHAVQAKFSPDTRFIVRPVPAPFRAIQETEFERLRSRLVTETLLAIAKPELNAVIRRAANEAGALAWVTLYPLLLFPALFEEKLRRALRQAERQAHILGHHGALIEVP
jgi:hypothetical protein